MAESDSEQIRSANSSQSACQRFAPVTALHLLTKNVLNHDKAFEPKIVGDAAGLDPTANWLETRRNDFNERSC